VTGPGRPFPDPRSAVRDPLEQRLGGLARVQDWLRKWVPDLALRANPDAWKNCALAAAFGLGIAVLALGGVAHAQAADPAININLGTGEGLTSRVLQLAALITVLSLAPSILIMTTSFVRIVVVLSLLRTAIGLQQAPPNVVIISLSLFLTAFVMQPVWDQAYQDGIGPVMREELELNEAFPRIAAPVKAFMAQHTRTEDLALFVSMAKLETPPASAAETPLRILIPAFMISELRRSFEIGFMLFVPFLIIDLVVSSLLMSMGMMMLPPVTISLPFKLIFFVLVDGWRLVAGSLVESFANGPPPGG
jgi:flagellar biosynthesis protein FliP